MKPSRIAEIIHLSDIHFGSNNITHVVGPAHKKRSLAELLLRDLNKPRDPLPIIEAGSVTLDTPVYKRIICITGDFAVAGNSIELDQAKEFLDELRAGLSWDVETARERIILISGNHDLEWDKPKASIRWQPWRTFYNDFYDSKSPADDPLAWVRLTKIKSANIAILCLDSEYHIYKESPYRNCGVIDEYQIDRVADLLKEANNDEWFRDAIKIAVVHHHPILIPSLVELGRGAAQTQNEPGYDAIFNVQPVLNLLHRYKFHMLLHGHKHIPHVFTEDIVNACHATEDHSMVVVSGGTLGSGESPAIAGWRQSYNQILIHSNPSRGSVRCQVRTRGLVRYDEANHELTWKDWTWTTMRTVDRSSTQSPIGPNPRIETVASDVPYPKDADEEMARQAEGRRLRGNMPVVEVRPSLIPGQDYEAKFWITQHHSNNFQQTEEDKPVKVVWSAGRLFPKLTILRSDDENFCGVFHCYGPMLLQAIIYFSDGTVQVGYIYAKLPETGASNEL